MERLKSGIRKSEELLIRICSFFLLFIVVMICAQVLTRSFGISLSGTEELARYGYVCFVFLAWPVIASRGNDLRVSVLSDLLPVRTRTVVMGIFNLVMAGYAGVMVYSMFVKLRVTGEIVASSNTWLKMKWVYWVVLAGLILTVLANLLRAALLISGTETIKTQDELNEEEIQAEMEKTRAMSEKYSHGTQPEGGVKS